MCWTPLMALWHVATTNKEQNECLTNQVTAAPQNPIEGASGFEPETSRAASQIFYQWATPPQQVCRLARHWTNGIITIWLRRCESCSGWTNRLNNMGHMHQCVPRWKSVSPHAWELVYLFERAPVLIMPQPFTVQCLVPANLHPEAYKQSLDYAP